MEDVVGQSLVIQQTRRPNPSSPSPISATIVGVVQDTDVGSIGNRREGVLYLPFEQHYESTMSVVVRSSNPTQTVAALPEMIRRADPGVAVSDIGTGVSLSGITNVPLRIAAGVTGLLGGVALVVAMTGLYGVLSYLVAGRRREIGVRCALGATTSNLLRMVVGDGLRPVVLGLSVGLVVAGALYLSAGRVLRNVPAVEPLVVMLVPALFVLAGLLACYAPARRATRVDPSVVLRDL